MQPATRNTDAMSAVETAAAVHAGTLSAEAAVAAALDAIATGDGRIEAWIHVDREGALAAARRVDRDGARGLLAGVPFGAKDNMDTHDMPTGYGTPVHAGKTPSRDASCIAMTRMAGAVLLGKTVSTELAHRFPGATRNPWNPAHTPGGSSSGSAAAVAAGMVPFAFGSQTTGSVIRPAAYCGVVGYKPTWGDVNASGMLANTPSFDTVGVMTRSVEDLALVRAGLLGEPYRAVEPAPIGTIRVGLCRAPFWDRADEETRRLIEGAAAALERAGAAVADFDDCGAFDDLEPLNRHVSGFEFARTLGHERLYALERLSASLRDGRLRDGLVTTYEEYAGAQRGLEQRRLRLDEAFRAHDVLVGPAAPGAAPEGLESTGSATFNMAWSTLHAPAVTVPVLRAANGLPIGLQVAAARRADARLLDCAATVMQALS